MADVHDIYVRTAAGQGEIGARTLHLSRVQRNLLIVMDGKSALGAYARISGCPLEQLGDVAASLVALGLIAQPGGAPSGPPAAGQGEASIQTLVAIAGQIFGAHAGPVVRKLEKSGGSLAELRAAVDAAAKLAKLTIDENKAGLFLAEARKLVGG